MAKFIYGGHSFGFELSNADDLARLVDACDRMDAERSALPSSDGLQSGADYAAQIRAVCAMYRGFFETLFPGNGEIFVGTEGSALEGMKAFDAFCAFLGECQSEMQRVEKSILAFYGCAGMTDGNSHADFV